jgi:acetyl esterase/lipase
MKRRAHLLPLLLVFFSLFGRAQNAGSWTWTAGNDYTTYSNITYSVADNYESKLDVYMRRGDPGVRIPTVIYIHGGGWVGGSKEASLTTILPYLEMGFSVVNVEYRLAAVSLAPAAVQDCRLAFRWVFKNAAQYGFDTTKIVITGHSAGGHLSLITGLLDPSAGFDLPTNWDYAQINPRAAAVINWYGITDVEDLLTGSNMQKYAVFWLGNRKEKEEIARSVSPLTYVRQGLPPVFTVHGDRDELVPYSHAVRLHEALAKAGVPNELLTIPGGKHGRFSPAELTTIYTAIRAFLKKHRIIG